MRLRNYLTIICAGLYQLASAQPRQNVNIDHVTIFLSGAELASSTRVNLLQGENTILFTNIAGNVNQQSLNIGADNDVVIQSATFQNNYLVAEVLSPKGRQIKDSIESIEAGRAGTTNALTVVNEQMDILNRNKQIAGANTGMSVTELTKMLDLIKFRLTALLNEKDKLNATLRKTDELLSLLQIQLDVEKKKDFQPGGQLLVKFYSPKTTSSNIILSYVVPNAGWTPTYDLRVENLKDPVKLFYKAQVYQNCGVKWDNVKITLSTGNPTEGILAPVLNPWHLMFNNPIAYNEGYLNSKNSVVMSYKVPLIDDNRKAITSEDIERMPTRNTSAGAYQQSTMANYVQTDNSGVNANYDIDLPYSIPTDGQLHLVAIKSFELPATYRHYAVPKLDKDAFLQAQITKWEDLDLIPGTTNIFYEGSYIGQGRIDMRNVRDTMNISLGRDKKIIIRRERDKELRSVKTIGLNVKESFVYTINMRNTRKEAVNITILEQLPVSNDKDIVIEDTDVDGGELDAVTGEVKWQLTLKPAEVVKKKIAFTVKYPKDKQINL